MARFDRAIFFCAHDYQWHSALSTFQCRDGRHLHGNVVAREDHEGAFPAIEPEDDAALECHYLREPRPLAARPYREAVHLIPRFLERELNRAPHALH